MVIHRDWHTTDIPITRETRRRTIKNWANYRDPKGEWHETNFDFRRATVDDKFEDLQLEWVADRAPLQFFVGKASSAGGRPWWGLRKSQHADGEQGLVMFLEQGDASLGYTTNGAEKSATWEDVLPDTDLILYAGVNKLEKWIALLSNTAGEGGHGDRATVGFYIPPGFDFEVENGALPGARVLLKKNGHVRWASKPAVAHDANGDDVPCTFIYRGTNTLGGRKYHRVQVRCDKRNATYPILMDPTVTIDTAAGIHDSYVSSTLPNTNYSYATLNYFKGNGSAFYQFRSLCRIADISLLPAGDYSSVKFSHVVGDKTGTILYHAVTDANDWDHRNSNWNQAGVATPWAGSAGGMTTIIDYDATAIGSQAMTNSATWKRFDASLLPSLFEDCRDGARDSNGFFVSTIYNDTFAWRSMEYATTSERPYFEIEYTVPKNAFSTATRSPVGQFPWTPYRIQDGQK